MRIIGLNGTAGSGKDTVYEMIRDALPNEVVRREAFADRLKISAAAALGFDGTDEERIAFCNQIKQEGVYITTERGEGDLTSISGREFLQRYGTEAHRDVFGRDFWLDAVLPFDPRVIDNPLLPKRYPGVDMLVITDVRFDNEAERVKDVGGAIWSIFRNTQINEVEHASEKPISPVYIDRVVPNIGSLDDLREQIVFNLGARV